MLPRLFLLVFLWAASPAWAQGFVLETGQEAYPMNGRVELFEDVHGNYSLEEIVQAPRERFERLNADRLRLIDTDARYWLKFSVTNQTDRKHWYLVSHYPWLNWFHLYRSLPGGGYEEVQGGQWLSRANWPLNHRLPVHPLKIEPGQVQTYFLYIYGSTLELWLKLQTPESLARSERVQHLGTFLYGGVALGLGFYNLFLALSIRSRTYLFYSLFVFCFAFGNLQYSGAFYPLLGHWPRFHMYADLLAWAGTSLWAVLFSVHFLGAHKRHPRLVLFLYASAGLIFLLSLLNYAESKALYYQAFNYLFFVNVALLYYLGIQAYRRGERQARFYLIGWGMLYVAIGLSVAKSMNWLPQWEVFDWTRQVGSALEIFFLSLALADRFNLLQQQNLSLQKSISEGLQGEVSQRTAELAARNLELERTREEAERANQTKEQIFSIIGHDLRGPMGSLSIILNEVVESPEEIDQETFEGMQQTSKNLQSLLEQLLDWAHSQQGRLKLEPSDFSLIEATESVRALFRGQLRQKDLTLRLDVPPTLQVYADLRMVTTVLRNLLGNAVKFSLSGGEVDLRARVQGGQVLVELIDQGVGIPPEVKEALFEPGRAVESRPGTGQEPGTGLGLSLCAQFVRLNGGEIGVESELGHGSRFWFTLPLAAGGVQQKVPGPQPGLRCLLVGGSGQERQAAIQQAQAAGLSVRSVQTAQEALQALEQEAADFVLVSVDLENRSGMAVVEALQAVYGAGLPLVALSPNEPADLAQARPDLSFAGHLSQPPDARQLARLVAQLTRH